MVQQETFTSDYVAYGWIGCDEDNSCKNNNIIIIPEIQEIPEISQTVLISGTGFPISKDSGIC